MKKPNIWDYFVVAVCTQIAFYIKSSLPVNYAAWEQIAISALGAVVAYFFFYYSLHLPLFFRFIRRLLIDTAITEGQWLEDVKLDGKKYYTIFHVYFDFWGNSYKVNGSTYTESGVKHADWTSIQVVFKNDISALDFFYDAMIIGVAEVRGHARLRFTSRVLGLPREGIGYFVDLVQPAKSDNYPFYRITSELIKSTLGDSATEINDTNRTEFIKKYHATTTRTA